METNNAKTNETTDKIVSANPLLDEATARAVRLEAAAQEAKFQADRLEQLKVNSMLSGTAGIRQEPVVKEETAKEYAERVMSNKDIKKHD
jgi:hypothetical protein